MRRLRAALRIGLRTVLPILLALLTLPAAAQQATPDVGVLIETLRTGDEAARTAALARLGDVAAEQPAALARWLSHPDPDVRFQVMHLLSARDARTEQGVRQMVEGRPTLAGTYPQALAARSAILEQAAREMVEDGAPTRTLDLLLRLAQRRATGDDLGARYAIVSLDLAGDIVRRHCREGRAAAEASALLAGLLEADLGDALHELAVCFAVLPPDLALSALRGTIDTGSPAARVRAARVLAEVADTTRAEVAAAAMQPLLGHRSPEVRLGALQALSLLAVAPGTLVPAGALAQDPAPDVAEEALRLGGERGLGFTREVAERLAADGRTPARLRRQAVRTLGLLGNAGSGPVLRALVEASGDRELRVLAAWSLGAVRADAAVDVILGLLATVDLRDEKQLFFALARAGAPGVEALGAMLDPKTPSGRARRIRAIEALGRTATDAEGAAPRAAVDVLVRVTKLPLAQHLGDARGAAVTEHELETVGRALGDLAPVCEEARVALARMVIERTDDRVLDALLPIVAEVGAPLDPELRRVLEVSISRLVAQLGGAMRPVAAGALLRVAPQQARELLTRMVGTGRGASNEETRELMHLLARAGDPTPVRQLLVPMQRDELDKDRDSPNEDRFDLQNRLGIELLYAHQLDEAVLEFRRMLWCRPTDMIPSYNVACGHALARRTEDALRALRRSVRHGYRDAPHMMADSDLDSLRDDPRFQRLLGRMRLDDETGVRSATDGWGRAPP